VRDYLAELIAQYFNRDFIVSSVYRAVGGAQAIAQALSARVAQLRLDAHIHSVSRRAKEVVVTMEDGSAEVFDTVAMHHDARLMPAYQDARPLFQTINPMLEVAPELVLQDCHLQRPIVDLATQANLQQLDVLHAQPERRVFFCDSYAAQGIPLLESAVASAKRLAHSVL